MRSLGNPRSAARLRRLSRRSTPRRKPGSRSTLQPAPRSAPDGRSIHPAPCPFRRSQRSNRAGPGSWWTCPSRSVLQIRQLHQWQPRRSDCSPPPDPRTGESSRRPSARSSRHLSCSKSGRPRRCCLSTFPIVAGYAGTRPSMTSPTSSESVRPRRQLYGVLERSLPFGCSADRHEDSPSLLFAWRLLVHVCCGTQSSGSSETTTTGISALAIMRSARPWRRKRPARRLR